MGRNEISEAARLERNSKPRLSLDHIIKERYPTFVDALRDLDDALSMLFLFANLPATSAVPTKTVARCQRLCLEFQSYLIVTRSLRKSFLSIKGIYYQATIQGQDILWLVPYQFVQRVTGDVDFRIMTTFVQFYMTLLGFVNFRLYTSIGLVYPPKFNLNSSENGGELRAFTLEGRLIGAGTKDDPPTNGLANGARSEPGKVRKANDAKRPEKEEALSKVVRRIAVDEENQRDSDGPAEPEEQNHTPEGAIDVFDAPISADADILPQPALAADAAASLFAPFTVYLSRETPRTPLEFLLRAFGCNRIGWDAVCGDGAFTTDELDPVITHQVVDRPPLPAEALPATETATDGDSTAHDTRNGRSRTRVPGRIYVQPQWIWDCVNAGKLLAADLYGPGAELPPHLSPWVKPKKGQYDPTLPLVDQEDEGEAEDVDDEDRERLVDGRAGSASSKGRLLAGASQDEEEEDDDDGGMDVADDDTSDEADAREADEPNWGGADDSEREEVPDKRNWGGADDSEGEEIPDERAEDQTRVPQHLDDRVIHEEEDDDAGDAEQDDETTRHQKELEAEAAGLPPPAPKRSAGAASKGETATAKKRRLAKARQEEELERRKMMMSRKKRKMLDKMLYSNRKKDDEALALRKKRRRIEREKGAG